MCMSMTKVIISLRELINAYTIDVVRIGVTIRRTLNLS